MPPLHEQSPATYFLRLNNLETFVELVGATPLHLLLQTALPLKSPTEAFIAPLRFANAIPPQTLLRTDEEELCQFDTIPPTASEASVRKQIAERNNVSESYVARSEKFMRGVEIMEQMVPGMQEKILSGQFKVRDADMHRLARADFPNRKQVVHEILHPEDRPAPQSSYSHYSEINYSALEAAVRRIQQDVDFLMRYLPNVPDDAYVKVETTKILKQHKAYMAQFEEMLNDKEIA